MNRIKRPVAATVLFTFLVMVLQPLSVLAQDRPLPLRLSKPAAPRPEAREDRFSTTLTEIHDLLKEVAPDAAMPHMFSRSKQEMELRAIGPGMRIEVERAKPAAGVDVAAKVMQIRGKAKELANLEEHVRTAFEESEKQIRDKNLPAEMLARHQEALASYNARYAEFKALLGAVERAASAGDAPLQTALSDLGAFMAKYPNKKIHAPTDPGKLPFGSPKPVTREPYTSPSQFRTSKLFGDPVIVAQSGSLSGVSLPGVTLSATPVPADTAPTEDVQITQAIRDLAASLGNNPVQIYNWVRNNIQFVPTYGSIQGSDVTLLTKRGNAFDTASLLIALLRAANVPSRYVYGTVQVPAIQAMNWVGGVSVPHAAIELMGQGGIPAAGVNSGGQVTAIRFEHVWVEAFVDYLPSRGAINRAPNTWVPLDAAFKQYQFTAPLDLTGAPFNANQLVSDVQQGTIFNEAEGWVQNINQPLIQQSLVNYHAQFASHVGTQKPNATVADVLGDKAVVQENRPILLGTLPYRTIIVGSRFQSIPNSLRHRISLKLFTSNFEVADDSPTMSYSAGIPALAGKRISFAYRPAAAADQAVIDSATAAGASSFPAYLVRFAPTIKVEDALVASAGGFTTGQPHMLVVTVHGPWEDRARTYHVQAGDFWVLGLNPAGASRELWTSRTQQRNLVDLEERDPAEMLHQIALGWWAQKYTLNDIFGATYGVRSYQMPSHALAGTPLTLRFSFGIARSASYKSRVLDAKEDTVIAAHIRGETKERRGFLLAAGQAGSYLEAGIFDQAFLLPPGQSMSAMTALKAASDAGLRIYTITQDNAFALGHIQTAPDDLQDMHNAVAAGLKVTTAQRDLTAGGFTGLGYILEDPQTGAAAYLISGGRNGGNSPQPADSVFPLPEVPANGAIGLVIGMSLRSAGAAAVTSVAAGAQAGAAVGGIAVGAGGLLPILGLILLILMLLFILIVAIDTLYPPTTERVRHYTRAFDKAARNPDGSPKDPNLPPRDIIEIEKYLAIGLLKGSATGTFDAGIYFADRTDSVPGVGSQVLFSCPPTAAEAQGVVVGLGLNVGAGETASERVSAYIDITFTRENWPPRERQHNGRMTEIIVRMKEFFYLRHGSYFGVTHDLTCGNF